MRMNFRAPSLVALCFLMVVAVALAYVAGVMRGRAYSDVPAASAVKRDGAGKPADSKPAGIEDTAAGGKRVLAPEELHFVNALRNDTAAAARQQDARTQPVKPAVAPSPSSGNAPGNSSPQPIMEAQPVLKAAKGALLDYVFQVAAFKDEDSVDSLRQRLEGRGLRTRMQREGKVLLVFVLLRGDEARAAEVLKLMEEMRLGVPITRSKKPVP